MSRQYNNFVTNLSNVNITVTTTEHEFLDDKKNNKYQKLSMLCQNNHSFTMKITSLANKFKAIKDGKATCICDQCIEKHSKEKNDVIEKCKILNFEIMSYDGKNRKVTYKCHCGHISETCVRNILDDVRQSHCPKCQNNKNRTPYETVKKLFEDNNCTLLSKTYINRRELLDYKCSCGNISKISYACFDDGERCEACRQDRYKQTCLERYQVDNVSKVEEFKEKSKETCREHFGVDHPMQNKEIKERSEQTCLEKYGVKWKFVLPEVYEKIRAIHKQNHGVEYPLQSEDIQAKIDLIFMQKYGATRPFLSPVFIKKYNEMMQEKYGSPWFVSSKEFTRQMVDKYGVEHAIQNPTIFKKAIQTSFKRREYISQDGKIWFVLGYENLCLDTLIKDENISCDIIKAGDDDEIPVCKYILKADGKTHIWYPDVWIEGDNRLIEVKSTWTYNKNPSMMKDKMDCCEYNCELWVYDGNKNIYEIVIKDKDGYRYLIGNKMEIGVLIN